MIRTKVYLDKLVDSSKYTWKQEMSILNSLELQ